MNHRPVHSLKRQVHRTHCLLLPVFSRNRHIRRPAARRLLFRVRILLVLLLLHLNQIPNPLGILPGAHHALLVHTQHIRIPYAPDYFLIIRILRRNSFIQPPGRSNRITLLRIPPIPLQSSGNLKSQFRLVQLHIRHRNHRIIRDLKIHRHKRACPFLPCLCCHGHCGIILCFRSNPLGRIQFLIGHPCLNQFLNPFGRLIHRYFPLLIHADNIRGRTVRILHIPDHILISRRIRNNGSSQLLWVRHLPADLGIPPGTAPNLLHLIDQLPLVQHHAIRHGTILS